MRILNGVDSPPSRPDRPGTGLLRARSLAKSAGFAGFFVSGLTVRSARGPIFLQTRGFSPNLRAALIGYGSGNRPERRSLGVGELQSPIQLALQDAAFRGQIFVPRQQLLIHRPANVGKHVLPVYNGPLGPTVVAEWRRH